MGYDGHCGRLARTIVVLGVAAALVAGCGGGGGSENRDDADSVVVPTSPEIPITPRDDHGDTIDDATALALGDSLPGEIENGYDADFFLLEVVEPGTLTVYTTGSLDTLGELQAGDGTHLAADDDYGEQFNFRIERIVSRGSYFVRVGGFDGAVGSYVVAAHFVPSSPSSDDHGNTRFDATVLALGGSVAGEVEAGGDEDYFRMELHVPGTLTVYTTGILDTLGELQEVDGTPLAKDDDLGEEYNFRIEGNFGPGTFFVRVRGYAGETGSYVVEAHFVPSTPSADDHGDTRSDATPLALGGALAGEIEEGSDDDFFRLEVVKPGTLTVYTAGSLDTVGELQAADGTPLANDDDLGDQYNFWIEQSVSSGTHFIRVGSFAGETGRYVLRTHFLPLPSISDDHGNTRSDATALALGGSDSGEIEEGEDEDYFRVEVTESGILTVYTTGGLDTVGELQAADGTLLADDDDLGKQYNFRIEYSVDPGTYFVRVGSYGQGTGAYSVRTEFKADRSDTIAFAEPVPVGSPVSERIDRPDDVDFFRLQVAHAGTLAVWTTGAVETDLVLLDSAGNELAAARVPYAAAASSNGVGLVRRASTGRNISSREIAVEAGTTVIAKVLGRSGIGSYTLGTRNVRAGFTNVISGTPGVSVTAGRSLTINLATHFDTSTARGELTYSVTFERPILVGGVPLGVAVQLDGSILTISSQPDGPPYSGSVGLKVEVREPFGLFALKILDMEFTREAPSGSCVDVRVFPVNNVTECLVVNDGGTHYAARFTNNCPYRVYIRYEWSKYSDQLPRPSDGLSGPVSVGAMSRPFATGCITGSPPRLRTCSYGSDPPHAPPVGANPCYSDNSDWN